MYSKPGKFPRRVVEYDAIRRRVWIFGQRCHHGATGVLVTAVACLGLAAETLPVSKPPLDAWTMLAAVATGGAMMVHDWKDRSIWFERGRGSQP